MSDDTSDNDGKDQDYEVGYRRPPRHTRFKPGKSGNPAGRPKGRKNLASIVRDLAYTSVSIQSGGKTRTVPAIEGLFRRLFADGLKGDRHSIETCLKYTRELLDAEPDTPDSKKLAKEDLAVLQNHAKLIAMIAAAKEDADGD